MEIKGTDFFIVKMNEEDEQKRLKKYVTKRDFYVWMTLGSTLALLVTEAFIRYPEKLVITALTLSVVLSISVAAFIHYSDEMVR